MELCHLELSANDEEKDERPEITEEAEEELRNDQERDLQELNGWPPKSY